MFFQTQNKDKRSQYGDTELAAELTHSPLPYGEVYTTGTPETSVRQACLQNGTKKKRQLIIKMCFEMHFISLKVNRGHFQDHCKILHNVA